MWPVALGITNSVALISSYAAHKPQIILTASDATKNRKASTMTYSGMFISCGIRRIISG